jgi:hypothetical protein
MRFMVLVKATKDTEAGTLPPPELFEAMGRFNEALAASGMLMAAEGLQPSAKGARIAFSGGRTEVIDGPFAETKELIAGYWMVQAGSLAEVIEMFRQCPAPHGTTDTFIEIRPVYDICDFPDEVVSPERKERARALRNKVAEQG